MEEELVTPTEQEEQVETTESVEDTTDWQSLAEKHQNAFKDQKRRAEQAEAKLKEFEAKQEKSTPKKELPESDRYTELERKLEEESTRNRLFALGVQDEEEQDEVVRAAKVLNLSVSKAIHHPLVAKMLEDKRSQSKTEEVTPSPSKRGGEPTQSVTRLAKEVQEGKTSLQNLDQATKTKVLEHWKKQGL